MRHYGTVRSLCPLQQMFWCFAFCLYYLNACSSIVFEDKDALQSGVATSNFCSRDLPLRFKLWCSARPKYRFSEQKMPSPALLAHLILPLFQQSFERARVQFVGSAGTTTFLFCERNPVGQFSFQWLLPQTYPPRTHSRFLISINWSGTITSFHGVYS